MRIIMNQTRQWSDYGAPTRQYFEGEVYDSQGQGRHFIPNAVAREFVRKGWAHEETADERLVQPTKPAPDLMAQVDDQMRRFFRPQSCRPTNPATLKIGEGL